MNRTSPWVLPALYLGWAYLFWIPLLASDESVWSFPNLLLFLTGGACPLFAGLLLAARTGGQAALRDLGRRLIDVRPASARCG